MKNTKLTAHPFAQLASVELEKVSGGLLKGDFKPVTLRIPEDGIGFDKKPTLPLGEDGNGPIYTTMAEGEEGGGLPPLM